MIDKTKIFDLVYEKWVHMRPKGVLVKNLHSFYSAPKDEYICMTKENFVQLIKEARLMGALEERLTNKLAQIPKSLSSETDLIQSLYSEEDSKE